ncbi:hypothetical protein AB4Y89_19380 [Terriglobus sp. 2YAB30_2]|uniref:hypothetical protein n=1 Tax=unclassified Terriglobus TaxID=2628988 RepID=UPI003F9A5080
MQSTHNDFLVLSIGDDAALLHNRADVLMRAGYNVLSLPSSVWLGEALYPGYGTVILCHTVPPARQILMGSALARAGVPIVCLTDKLSTTALGAMYSEDFTSLFNFLEQASARYEAKTFRSAAA